MSWRRFGTKVNPDFFSKMEQKLVQRCETEIVADACNASYKGDFVNSLEEEVLPDPEANQEDEERVMVTLMMTER